MPLRTCQQYNASLISRLSLIASMFVYVYVCDCRYFFRKSEQSCLSAKISQDVYRSTACSVLPAECELLVSDVFRGGTPAFARGTANVDADLN